MLGWVMNIQSRAHEPLKLWADLPHGACRRLWTVDDLYRMAQVGILHEDDNAELLSGRVMVKEPPPPGETTFPWVNDVPDGAHARRWTADELERMARAGIVGDEERLELIGGEIIAMSPKGARHEILRSELVMLTARVRPDDVKIASETPLHLATNQDPQPDIFLFPAPLYAPDVRGDTVLLVVEVSDSSLSYDLHIKSGVYATAGVREYWVIDPNRL